MSSFNCIVRPLDVGYCEDINLIYAQIGIATILSLLLIGLALLFAGVFFQSHPLSVAGGARAHGRAHVLMLLIETLLVLTIQTFSVLLPTVALLAILGFAGIAWLLIFLALLPFYAFFMNAIHIMGAAVYLWVFICLCINLAFGAGADAIAVLLMCGSPFAALAGYALATWRANAIFKTPPARLLNAFEVEIKARFMLHNALHGHPYESLSSEAAAAHTAALQAASA